MYIYINAINRIIKCREHRKAQSSSHSGLNLLEPQPVLNGRFRFVHEKQVHNKPVSHKYHQIQSIYQWQLLREKAP